ncbi:MAG TPA: hypothetical protein VM536_23070 [Chloroflexia bacterium]|nr:hypothetical protein [Chloroflexia bacterium]
MHYNSIDHFLQENEPAITALMAAAQEAAGGHYAAMSPEQSRQTAADDARQVMRSFREMQLDRESIQADARRVDGEGINLDDLTRMASHFTRHFEAFAKERLTGQPDLAREMVRRCGVMGTTYTANVTTVKLDKTLRRMQRP